MFGNLGTASTSWLYSNETGFPGPGNSSQDLGSWELESDASETWFRFLHYCKYSLDSCELRAHQILQEDIRKVLGQAIKQLLDLQYQVSTLLNFFKAVFRHVDSIDSQMTHDLLGRVNEEGFREDEDIKEASCRLSLNEEWITLTCSKLGSHWECSNAKDFLHIYWSIGKHVFWNIWEISPAGHA